MIRQPELQYVCKYILIFERKNNNYGVAKSSSWILCDLFILPLIFPIVSLSDPTFSAW